MRRRPIVSLATALTMVLPPLVGAQSVAPARTKFVLDSLSRDFAVNGMVPGTAIAVVRGRDTLLFKAYGKADLELNVPMTATSVFRIGSVTKQFTSAAVMQLVQDGKVAVTDTIGQWVPNLPVAWRGVTVAHLLNHTSGIPSYTEAGEPWMKRWGEDMTGADIVALTADKPFDFADGTSWKYNNTGYVLLGMLIEARTGRDWHADFAARFFTPLGMTQTKYCDAGPLIANRARGYSRSVGDEWVNARYLSMTQPHAAGALCSTLGDLLIWNRALHGGKVVSAATYTTMTTPVGAATERGYASGLGIEDLGGHRVVSHGGGINGFITANMFVPDVQLSVTVLTNGDFTNTERIAHQLARAALGVPLEVPPKGIAITSAQMAVYAGVYDITLDARRDFTVFAKDGALFGMVGGQSPEKMIPLGNDTFGVAFDPAVRLTFTVVGGKATKFTLRQGGADRVGIRKP
jgi:D-alanyl-D-alanine carboxypeptidase